MFSSIAFTETWLTADRDKAFSLPGFYSVNIYRNQYGGGLRLNIKGVDREKSAVFKELTQSFRTYELRGQAKKKKSSNRIKDKQVPHTLLQKLSQKSLTSPLNKDIDLRG